MRDFHPTLLQLIVKAAFLWGLFNLRVGVLIVASQRQGGPVRLIPAPGSAWRGGLGRPQPVLLPLFTQGLGAGWTTPLSTWHYNGKQGSGRSSRLAHTHAIPLISEDRLCIIWEIQGRGKERRGGGLLTPAADLWMENEEEEAACENI